MIFFHLLKNRLTTKLFILFITLQTSACGTEELLTAITPDIGSNTSTDINTNSAAKISGIDTGSVIEDIDPDGNNLLEVNGKLNIDDNDNDEAAFIAKTVNGIYGNLDIDVTGSWHYAANNQQTVIQNLTSNAILMDSLTISSVDGTTHTIAITIIGVLDTGTAPGTGANNPAVITGIDSGNVTEDVDPDGDNLLEVGGKLNITDNDADQDTFIVTTYNGRYGGLIIDISGNWNYAANNNQTMIQNLNTGATLTDNLVISSVDGTTHTVIITIKGADEINSIPVITGISSENVTEDIDPDGDNLLEVGAKLNITDNNPGEAAFIARTVTGSYGSLTINTTGNWNYAANNNQTMIQNLNTGATLTDNMVVSSVDGTTHTVKITINGADENSALADINLSWLAPAEREDNSAISLSEIAGYKISYGMSQGQYPNSVIINDGTAVGYTFTDFPTGSYYFVVTTLDTEGRESQYSTEVKIII